LTTIALDVVFTMAFPESLQPLLTCCPAVATKRKDARHDHLVCVCVCVRARVHVENSPGEDCIARFLLFLLVRLTVLLLLLLPERSMPPASIPRSSTTRERTDHTTRYFRFPQDAAPAAAALGCQNNNDDEAAADGGDDHGTLVSLCFVRDIIFISRKYETLTEAEQNEKQNEDEKRSYVWGPSLTEK
jgi:hypothetical protein